MTVPTHSPSSNIGSMSEASGVPTDYNGRGFMYVAVCSGPEDMIKVGLSHDPLERWSAFHSRWFEAFDLEHSLLIETETRRDAQELETELHRLLVDHNCPPPMTIRSQVGGGTEWYRGAYCAALAFARSAADRGYVVHLPARTWFAKAMESRRDNLMSVLDQSMRYAIDNELSDLQRNALRDLVDAHIEFDHQLAARLTADLLALRKRETY